MSTQERSVDLRLAQLEKAVGQIQQLLDIPPTIHQPAVTPKPAEKSTEAALEPAVKLEPSLTIEPAELASANAPAQTGQPRVSHAPTIREPKEPGPIDRFFQRLTQPEFLLNTLGSGLLLLGLIFMFGYAIANDWFSPAMWVGIGYLFGTGLIGLGWRLSRPRPIFSQFLFGSGIAAFYITTYSASSILELIGVLPTLALMSATTAAAYGLSIWQKHQTLALIGTVGGFVTPFLLPTEESSALFLMVYNLFIVGGSIAIFYRTGWRGLLMFTAVGGWLLQTVSVTLTLDLDPSAFSVNLVIQSGIFLIFVALGILPSVQGLLSGQLSQIDLTNDEETPSILSWAARLLFLVAPVIALFSSQRLWELELQTTGTLLILAGLAYGLVSLQTMRRSNREITDVAILTGVSLVTLGLLALFDENRSLLLAILTVEALLLAVMGRIATDRVLSGLSHFLYLMLYMVIFVRFWDFVGDSTLWSMDTFVELFFMGSMVVAARFYTTKDVRTIYDLGANLMLVAWLGNQFGVIEENFELLSLLYILCGSLIIVPGVFYRDNVWLVQGILTLYGGGLAASIGWIDGFDQLDNLNVVLFTLTAAGLLYANTRQENRLISVGGHLAVLGATVWVLYRLLFQESPVFLFHVAGLINLALIGLIAYVSVHFASKEIKPLMVLAAHVTMLGWFGREAAVFENNDALTSAMWGVYAVILILLGVYFSQVGMRRLGLGTILLVVAKLFVVDLANVSTFIRIFLFIGFGIMLLTTSYFFRSLWNDEESPEGTSLDEPVVDLIESHE